jgi:hypothetical protein
MAVRRLKEALDEIPELEGLNHVDERFEAWRENLRRILNANWPNERLPNFQSLSMRVTPFGGRPRPRIRLLDLDEYRKGM